MKNIFSMVGVTTAMAICSASTFADDDRRMRVDQDSLRDADAIVKGYEDGKTILFDLSSEELKEEKKVVMSQLSGMVIGDQKMVYLKKGPEGSQFLVLEKQMRAEKQAQAIEKFEYAQQPSARTRRSASTRAATPPLDESGTLKPRVNTVTLRKDDISCLLPKYTGLATVGDLLAAWRQQEPLSLLSADVDYCNNDAGLELNYKIDMFGSKVVTKMVDGRQVSTEAGKYFVVTVSPDAQAGTGWHIADELKRNKDFSTTLAASIPGKVRGESVGPIVNRYQFWVRKPADPEIRLVEQFPGNKERMISINETRGINAGITGTIGGNLGIRNQVNTSTSTTTGKEPSTTVGGGTESELSAGVQSQLQGAVQQSNNRTLNYNGTEYTIENKSTAKLAKWVWNLNLEDDSEKICDYLVKKDLNTCFHTLPLLDTGWIINARKFSAATYASFIPAFQAVFMAAPQFAKTSTFELGTSVELASFVGATQPAWTPELLGKPGNLVPGIDGVPQVISSLMPNILKFSADIKTTPVQSVTESFTVDWDQPYFAPEANIRLQVMSPPVDGVPETLNTLCLSANFNANTNANTNATATLTNTRVEAQMAVTAAANAGAAVNEAEMREAAALKALRENDTSAMRAAYNAATAETAQRRQAQTVADAAVVKANTAVRVAEQHSSLANAKVATASFEKCSNKKEQVWGYDAEEKLFKSRAVKGAEYCLAYPNLDRRLSGDDSLITTPERNAVEIWPCSGLDNRQKWVLQSNGLLQMYTGINSKALSYGVEVQYAKDRYGDRIVQNGNYVLERLPHTGMSAEGTYQKKIQAFPAQF